MLLRQARLNYAAIRALSAVSRGHGSLVVRTGLGTHASSSFGGSGLFRKRNDELVLVAVRYAGNDRDSKVESTLRMLKEELKVQQDEESKKLKLVPRQDHAVKPSLMQKVVHELKHYYHGFRLLALETKLSAKYLWKIVRGKTLTRRERQQMVRTVSDLFRMVPFSIFIIVPFMELALPIFIKLFPGMLPSTFQTPDKEEEKIRRQVKVKVEMAKFLQDTIEEIALERKKESKEKDNEGSKSLEFARFIKKARHEGGYVSNADLLKFVKLFEDELTLDNLSMSQLRALCRLIGVNSIGSPEILRFQLNMKLRELKADDKQIAAEGGVDALTTLDLQQACRARGMRAIGVSEARLKDQLNQWLELSLSDKVPPSLMLLSRALYLPEDIPFTDRLKSLVSQLPDGIAEQTRQKLTEMEGGTVDHKARIELIRKIEEAIAGEKALNAEAEKKKAADAEAKKKAKEEAEVVAEGEQKEKKAEAKPHEEPAPLGDTAAKKVAESLAEAAEAVRVAATKTAAAAKGDLRKEEALLAVADATKKVEAVATIKKKEEKVEATLDKKDLSAIEDVLLGGPLHEAKYDITELKEKVFEHTEDLIEVNALDEAFAESKVAKRLRSKVESMIANVDTLVSKMEEKKASIDESIADPAFPEEARIKRESQVRVADVIERLKKMRKEYAEAEADKIAALITALDEDTDGIIDSDVVLEVISLLEKHSDVAISPSQLASMIEVIKKEDRAEALESAMESEGLTQPITVQPPIRDEPQASSSSKAIEPPEIDPKITAPHAAKQKDANKEKNSQV